MAYKSIPGYKKPYFVEVPSNPAKSLEIISKNVDFLTFLTPIPYNPTNPFIGNEKIYSNKFPK